jgi:hypothetical protein
MTVGCAVVVSFLIADFPEEAKWLSDDEKAFVKARLAEDMGDSQLNAQADLEGRSRCLQGFQDHPRWSHVLSVVVPGIWLCLLRPRYHPILRLQPRQDSALLCPSLGCHLHAEYDRRYCLRLLQEEVHLHPPDDAHLRRWSGRPLDCPRQCEREVRSVVLGCYGRVRSAAPIIICWFSANRESISMPSSDSII